MLNNIFNKYNKIFNSSKTACTTVSNHVSQYPVNSNLHMTWGYGSLLGLYFALQLISGIFLAMHYVPHTDHAFLSVIHIMRDVKDGYVWRYAHANGASMIFIFLYIHVGRGLYFMSYLTKPKVWWSGLVIFLLMMATAFIGYVLPWGQMSFWGATVITSLLTAIPYVGEDIVYWIWGGPSISNATLTRFYSIHYTLPFIITGLIFLHLVLLHDEGSSSPMQNNADRIRFSHYFMFKDLHMFTLSLLLYVYLVFRAPNLLGHADNWIPANPLVTPPHIVPEWYFTPFYAILRACPNKIGGAVSMLGAILVLFILPIYQPLVARYRQTAVPFSIIHKFLFWCLVTVFGLLMFCGMSPAAAPFIMMSKILSILYFIYFLFIIPLLILLS